MIVGSEERRDMIQPFYDPQRKETPIRIAADCGAQSDSSKRTPREPVPASRSAVRAAFMATELP